MPVSPAKLAANRANARKSTGPRSDSGKMASAHNARKHGLSSRDLYVPAERQAEFQTMREGYLAEIQPVGHVQQELFDQLLHAAWYLRLARRLHAQALESGDLAQVDRLHRYVQQHERSYHRALKQLRATQTDRAIRCLPEHAHLDALPDPVEPVKLLRALHDSQKRTHRPVRFQPSGFRPAAPPRRKAS